MIASHRKERSGLKSVVDDLKSCLEVVAYQEQVPETHMNAVNKGCEIGGVFRSSCAMHQRTAEYQSVHTAFELLRKENRQSHVTKGSTQIFKCGHNLGSSRVMTRPAGLAWKSLKLYGLGRVGAG